MYKTSKTTNEINLLKVGKYHSVLHMLGSVFKSFDRWGI